MATQHQIPLLADHHSHPLLYAAFAEAVDLSNVRSEEQACDLLNQAGRNRSLVVGHGWKDNFFVFEPSRFESLPPVAVFNLSLHNLQVNSAGRAELISVCGDEVAKLDDRHWYEANLRVVLNWFATLGGSADALKRFYEHLESIGVWSAEEMLLVSEQEIIWFDEADLADRTRFWAAPDTYSSLSETTKRRVHGIKLFTDGALGARTAALNRPYADDPRQSNRGMLIYSDQELEAAISSAAEIEKGIAIHAIGDRAIEQSVQALENIGNQRSKFTEIRIEHAQLISTDFAQRAKRLGATLSMQPNFTSDSQDYAERLGPEYARANNPFRMLIDQAGFEPGVDLIFGSDGMPHGAHAALSQSLHPIFGSQRLTIDEFIAGYGSGLGAQVVEI